MTRIRPIRILLATLIWLAATTPALGLDVNKAWLDRLSRKDRACLERLIDDTVIVEPILNRDHSIGQSRDLGAHDPRGAGLELDHRHVDHRITDGLEAARFVENVKQKLEDVDFPGFAARRSQA